MSSALALLARQEHFGLPWLRAPINDRQVRRVSGAGGDATTIQHRLQKRFQQRLQPGVRVSQPLRTIVPKSRGNTLETLPTSLSGLHPAMHVDRPTALLAQFPRELVRMHHLPQKPRPPRSHDCDPAPSCSRDWFVPQSVHQPRQLCGTVVVVFVRSKVPGSICCPDSKVGWQSFPTRDHPYSCSTGDRHYGVSRQCARQGAREVERERFTERYRRPTEVNFGRCEDY